MSPGEVALILFGTFGVLIIMRVPVAFALGLACVPVFFISDRLTPSLLFDQMFKSYNSFILLAVPFFLLAANLMNSAGITQRLINLSRVSVGHLPGGLGHVNVVVSMLFAGISGSSTADAAGIGSLLIPQMKKEGYDTRFAVAVTACSSVMGVVIPPSILMVVWGGLMSVSIGGLFLAGVLPGILIAVSMMAVVYVYAIRRGYPVYPRATLKEFGIALAGAILPLATPAIIIGGIVGGLFTPTEASVVAVLYSLVLGMVIYRTITPKRLPMVLYESARFAAISLFCIGTASAFGWILAYFKIPQALVNEMASWGAGLTETGLLIALAFLIFGMFIDAIPAIIILGTVLYPVAQDVGMHPIHFAIIGVVSLAFGLVTPPYGICLLISSAIGGIKNGGRPEGRRRDPVRDDDGAPLHHPVPGRDPRPAALDHAPLHRLTQAGHPAQTQEARPSQGAPFFRPAQSLVDEGALHHVGAGVVVGAFGEAALLQQGLRLAQHRHRAADHRAVGGGVERGDAERLEQPAGADEVGDAPGAGVGLAGRAVEEGEAAVHELAHQLVGLRLGHHLLRVAQLRHGAARLGEDDAFELLVGLRVAHH